MEKLSGSGGQKKAAGRGAGRGRGPPGKKGPAPGSKGDTSSQEVSKSAFKPINFRVALIAPTSCDKAAHLSN